jgi:hypothetical protein
MKNIRIVSIFVTLMVMYISCEELPDPAGLRGVAVIPGLTDLDPGIFDSKNLSTTFVEFKVTIPEGESVEKVMIQGSYGDELSRVTITELTTFPATVRITAASVAQKLGISLGDIENGDIFIFELVTTVKGKAYRSSSNLIIPVACAYDVNLATGSYHCNGGDWGSDGTITLTADPGDPYKIYVVGLEEIEGLTEDLGPYVIHIDPATYEVDAPKKAIASSAFGYHNIAYEGYGTYNSCNGSYSLIFTITVDEGSFGDYEFTFTRNP